MALYNVVSLTFGNNTHTFYGRQDEHDHSRNGAFVQAAIGLMVQQYNCSANQVAGGSSLRIRQPKPSTGNELRWVTRSRSWEQA
jgi:hypothetical protein